MTKQDIIQAYTELGILVAKEYGLGKQLIELTAQQRKAHQQVLEAKDRINNMEFGEEKV